MKETYHQSVLVASTTGSLILLVISSVIWSSTPLYAQSESAPLLLDHADSTALQHREGATEYQLYGNVQFTQGRTTLTSDRATWSPETGNIEFTGHVRIRRPGRFVRADRMEYHRDGRTIIAWGDVLVDDTTQSFSLVSERGRFDRANEIAVADSLPTLTWDFFLDSAARTIIRADTISYFRAAGRGLGEGNVDVLKGGWTAHGARGEIWPDSGRAILTGRPQASGLGGAISGDTLELVFVGGSVEQVIARGGTAGSYRDTAAAASGSNLLRGDRTDFFLDADTLRAIRVIGQAYTDHVSADSAGESNHASGDSLWLHFDNGRLVTMTVAGGAKGRYVGASEGSADTVDYHGALIRFLPDSNRIDLEAEAQMRYGSVVLDAGHISYWTDSRSLMARPLPDPESAEDTLGSPRLTDGDQVVTGEYLTYNIKTRRGRIRGSATELEDGWYYGSDFRKYTDSVFFVSDGIYTTCDRPVPHYYFKAKDMVVVRDDKVIARPVVMRIGKLPVAALPFYVFPIKRGRRSGFLPFRFGNFERGRRFIGNVGYYWAASDYWDLESALDFNEETGVRLRSTFNYALRYQFSGHVSGSYARESRLTQFGQTKTTRWSLQAAHQQTLSPTSSLSGNAHILSDKSYYQDYTSDPTDRRNRSLRSQLTYQKRFSGASISASALATKNLDTDQRQLQLPQIALSLTEKRLFSPDSGQDGRWYHNAYAGLRSNLSHFQRKDPFTSVDPVSGDTTEGMNEKHYLTVTHSGRLRFPQKVLSQITVSPNASFTEAWYYVFATELADSEGVRTNEPARRLSGSVGVSTNTNLYGFIHPRLFGLSTIRHTLSPRFGYAFTPAVTQNDALRSFTGAGGGSSRRSQSLSLSIANVFDAKLHEGKDETKVSLLNLNFNTRYDFEREERRWGLLSGSARTTVARQLDLTADATWDLYDEKTLDLQWTKPRLTNFSFTSAMSLRGTASGISSVTELGAARDNLDTVVTGAQIPFNVSLSYRYSENRGNDLVSKTHWIAWRFDLQPTANWSLQYQQTYDLVRNTVTDQTFEFRRDLHCWEAKFVWVPGGSRKGYYFRIGVKRIPDIKLERSESGLRGGF